MTQKPKKINSSNFKYILGGVAILFFAFPISLNYIVSNGLFGWRPIKTEFADSEWFSFWYSYFPSILAFTGTLIAIFTGVKQNRDLMKFEEKNFAYSIIPTLKFMFNNVKVITLKSENSALTELQDYEREYRLTKEHLSNEIDSLIDKHSSNQELCKALLDSKSILSWKNTSSFYIFNDITLNQINILLYKKNMEENQKLMKLFSMHRDNIDKYAVWENALKSCNNKKNTVMQDNVEKVLLYLINSYNTESKYINCLKFDLELFNSGVTDIISFRLNKIEVTDEDSSTYSVNEDIQLIIHQSNSDQTPNKVAKSTIDIELCSTDFLFDKERPIRVNFEFEIKTAAGYRYYGANYVTLKEHKTNESYASLNPVI